MKKKELKNRIKYLEELLEFGEINCENLENQCSDLDKKLQEKTEKNKDLLNEVKKQNKELRGLELKIHYLGAMGLVQTKLLHCANYLEYSEEESFIFDSFFAAARDTILEENPT